MSDSVIITVAPTCTVDISTGNATVEVGMTTIGIRGPQGPQGPPGPPGPSGSNDIGGYPVVVNNLQPLDLIQFQNGLWHNVPQENIVDGGTF